MALFSKDSKEKVVADAVAPIKGAVQKPAAAPSVRAAAPTARRGASARMSDALIRPRITEKGALLGEKGSYIFDVAERANKRDIAQAMALHYKVTPTKVHVTRVPDKNRLIRGKKGVKSGGKKAYVFLRKGERIEIA